jgi:hypothetical protein
MTLKMGSAKADKAGLYERDYYSWALEQERALLDHRTEELDWENLADEVGDLARSERRALKSQAARLIEHLLKLAFASPSAIKANQRLWRLSLRGSRREIGDLLAESPGLRPSAQDLFSKAWLIGRDEALKFLKVADDTIAETPLWSFEQAMDEKFEPSK